MIKTQQFRRKMTPISSPFWEDKGLAFGKKGRRGQEVRGLSDPREVVNCSWHPECDKQAVTTSKVWVAAQGVRCCQWLDQNRRNPRAGGPSCVRRFLKGQRKQEQPSLPLAFDGWVLGGLCKTLSLSHAGTLSALFSAQYSIPCPPGKGPIVMLCWCVQCEEPPCRPYVESLPSLLPGRAKTKAKVMYSNLKK